MSGRHHGLIHTYRVKPGVCFASELAGDMNQRQTSHPMRQLEEYALIITVLVAIDSVSFQQLVLILFFRKKN